MRTDILGTGWRTKACLWYRTFVGGGSLCICGMLGFVKVGACEAVGAEMHENQVISCVSYVMIM